MSAGLFNLKKALQLFGTSSEELSAKGLAESSLPEFARSPTDNRLLKSWTLKELPAVGQHVGFMKKPTSALAVAVFVTKGGVLKSSLTMNLARMAALHGIRTCVVGLDMQGDITSALSSDELADEDASLKDALEHVSSRKGLADLFTGANELPDIILPTDLPTLFYIPETPELVALDQSLMNRNRREYWIRDHVVNPLKKDFDLIIMDCSPNWNRLITNALVACDVLLSPVECKINNFRNFKTFRALLAEFKDDMGTQFKQIFVPTRLVSGRKLSREIYEWYRSHLPECAISSVRENLQGEEAMALRCSVPEFAPNSIAACEMRELLREIWTSITMNLRTSEVSAKPKTYAHRSNDFSQGEPTL